MLTDRLLIYQQIEKERLAQDKQWGGPQHDDGLNLHNWIACIVKQLGIVASPFSRQAFRIALVKIAALAVAAIESLDRKNSAPTR